MLISRVNICETLILVQDSLKERMLSSGSLHVLGTAYDKRINLDRNE